MLSSREVLKQLKADGCMGGRRDTWFTRPTETSDEARKGDGKASMEYVAKLTKEGRYTLVEFPDCPGCSTFVDPDEGEEIVSVARDALEGWLVAHLIDGDAPPTPTTRSTGSRHESVIRVAPTLAIALQIRWRRLELGWSQAQVGRALGVTRQQAASLEDPSSNLRMSTLEKVAAALSLELDVELHPV